MASVENHNDNDNERVIVTFISNDDNDDDNNWDEDSTIDSSMKDVLVATKKKHLNGFPGGANYGDSNVFPEGVGDEVFKGSQHSSIKCCCLIASSINSTIDLSLNETQKVGTTS